MKVENKGKITLSDKVRVTDPCYGVDTWCAGTLENVLPGEFNCSYIHEDKEWFTGKLIDRVTSMEVRHESYPDIDPTEYVPGIDVGVDSGQAGIFDYPMYKEVCADAGTERNFYQKVCNATVVEKMIENKNYVPFNKSEYFKKEYQSLEKRDFYEDIYPELQNLKKEVSLMEGEDTEEVFQLKRTIELYESYKSSIREYEYSNSSKREIMSSVNTGDTIDNKGFVTASGDGDGSYALFVGRNEDGKIVSMKIDYYPDYEMLMALSDENNKDLEESSKEF